MMEIESDNSKNQLSILKLIKLSFFYLITLFSFCAAFYEALYISNFKISSLLFLVAFLSFAFANYSEFKQISALGFKIEKFDRLTSEAEILVHNLKVQSALLVDEMISSKIEMNRMMDVNLRWKQLKNFRKSANQNGSFVYSDEQIKKIKTFFYFDYIHYRFKKIFQTFIEEIHQEFNKFKEVNFPEPIIDINSFNNFVGVERKILELLKIPEIDQIEYSTFDVKILKEKLDLVLEEMAKFNLNLRTVKEFEVAIEDLKEVLKSSDVLSDKNLDLFARARELSK